MRQEGPCGGAESPVAIGRVSAQRAEVLRNFVSMTALSAADAERLLEQSGESGAAAAATVECAICLDDIDAGAAHALACGHLFHTYGAS
eukprot:gene45154-16573_t